MLPLEITPQYYASYENISNSWNRKTNNVNIHAHTYLHACETHNVLKCVCFRYTFGFVFSTNLLIFQGEIVFNSLPFWNELSLSVIARKADFFLLQNCETSIAHVVWMRGDKLGNKREIPKVYKTRSRVRRIYFDCQSICDNLIKWIILYLSTGGNYGKIVSQKREL